jgi:hypothetical protein
MQPVLSPIARIAATSSALRRRSAGIRPSSTRLASIGQASGPASWISVGTTHSTAGWARFHWQASWIGVSPARFAIGSSRSSFSSPASIQPAGRNARWSPAARSMPGRRSRPPA